MSEEMTYARRIALTIWRVAMRIEEHGNRGMYIRDVDVSKIGKQYRDGILFYSRGHGWRVRRDPDWRTVFKARFSAVYAEMTEGES